MTLLELGSNRECRRLVAYWFDCRPSTAPVHMAQIRLERARLSPVSAKGRAVAVFFIVATATRTNEAHTYSGLQPVATPPLQRVPCKTVQSSQTLPLSRIQVVRDKT